MILASRRRVTAPQPPGVAPSGVRQPVWRRSGRHRAGLSLPILRPGQWVILPGSLTRLQLTQPSCAVATEPPPFSVAPVPLDCAVFMMKTAPPSAPCGAYLPHLPCRSGAPVHLSTTSTSRAPRVFALRQVASVPLVLRLLDQHQAPQIPQVAAAAPSCPLSGSGGAPGDPCSSTAGASFSLVPLRPLSLVVGLR